MTPRSLITAIGATALAFAVAIGVASESTTGVATDATSVAAASYEIESDGAADVRLAAWNDSCAIAV